MKQLFKKFLFWLYVQIYVAFAVIIFSKKRLARIALAGGNNPLVILATAKWMRVWWFSLLGIVIWFILGAPILNLFLKGDLYTWYSSMSQRDDTVTLFDTYTMNISKYILLVIVSGKLLQIIEIVSCNKMEYFKRFIHTPDKVRSYKEFRKLST